MPVLRKILWSIVGVLFSVCGLFIVGGITIIVGVLILRDAITGRRHTDHPSADSGGTT